MKLLGKEAAALTFFFHTSNLNPVRFFCALGESERFFCVNKNTNLNQLFFKLDQNDKVGYCGG